jgi:hypothetical protein
VQPEAVLTKLRVVIAEPGAKYRLTGVVDGAGDLKTTEVDASGHAGRRTSRTGYQRQAAGRFGPDGMVVIVVDSAAGQEAMEHELAGVVEPSLIKTIMADTRRQSVSVL